MNTKASNAPSLILSPGKWGKKSFPTKKQRKTKSSIILSKSYLNGSLTDLNSKNKYSLSTDIFIN